MGLMNIARVQQHFNQLFEKMPASTPLYISKNDAELN
jgi:hypothetical protein